MNILKELKWNVIFTSIIYIGIGVIFLFIPDTSFIVILNILAVGVAFAGLLSLLRYFSYDPIEAYRRNDFLIGLICLGFSLLLFIRKDVFASFMPILLGAVILLSGFMKLQDAVDAKRLGYQQSLTYIILATINVLIGAVIVFNPFNSIEVLFAVMGCGMIYSGLSDLISAVYLSSRLNKIVSEKTKTINENLIAQDSDHNETEIDN